MLLDSAMLQTVIFKVGGSLFDLGDLAIRLEQARSLRPNATCLIFPGGGSVVECVREWDNLHTLGEEVSHQLAMRALDTTTDLLGQLLPNSIICDTPESIASAANSNGFCIMRPRSVLAEEESRSSDPLPHSWDVTSDAIAAWMAIRWNADELVLLKSAPMPSSSGTTSTARQGAKAGLVDPYFPELSHRLPSVSWCNVRSLPISIETWFTNSTLSP